MTKEFFKINDIELEVNPSDIKLLDDNYVTEESYLRTNAVYANRSRYAATRIAITIPVEITDALSDALLNASYKTLPDTYKLIVQLNTYPFCFIKSKRIEGYISPTNMSSTNFMLFAVDEINLLSRSEVSNILFLELVLVFFNHTPFIKDFSFAKYLNLEDATGVEELALSDNPEDFERTGVLSLSDSLAWVRYFNNIFFNLSNNLRTENFQVSSLSSDFSSLGVTMSTPIVKVITSEGGFYDDALTNANTKYVISTNTEGQASEAYELLYTDKVAGQNFTPEALSNGAITAGGSINSENVPLPTGPVGREAVLKALADRKQEDNSRFFDSMKLYAIDWVDLDLKRLGTSVQTCKIRRKNKLAMNHIGSHKHPVIQHLGRYPTEVTLQFVINSANQYMTESGPVTLLKDQLNVIDYNKVFHPETMVYNYLKIKTLPTFLLGATKFLPNQSHISANSSEQGIDSFVMTFVESDLEELLQTGLVVNSGKNAGGQAAMFTHNALIAACSELKQLFQDEKRLGGLQQYDRERNIVLYSNLLLLLNNIYQEFGEKDVTLLRDANDINSISDKAKGLALALVVLDTSGSGGLDLRAIAGVIGGAVAGVATVLTGVGIPATAATVAAGMYLGYSIADGLVANGLLNSNPYFYARIFEPAYYESDTIDISNIALASTAILPNTPNFLNSTQVSGVVASAYTNKPATNLQKNVIDPATLRVDFKSEVTTTKVKLPNSVLDFHLAMLDKIIIALKQRMDIITNKVDGNAKNVTFGEKGETNYLIKNTLALLSIAASNGEPLAVKVTSNFQENFFQLFGSSSTAFLGQAIPDLNLQQLLPQSTPYVEETDTVIQGANPFFFLKEEKWINPVALRDAYQSMTELDNTLEESLGNNISDIIDEQPKVDRAQNDPSIESFDKIRYPKLIETTYTDTKKTETELQRQQEANLKAQDAAANSDVENLVYNNSDAALDNNAAIPRTGRFPKNLSEVAVNHDRSFLLNAKYQYLKNLNITDDQWLVLANGVGAVETSNYDYSKKNPKTNFYGKFQMGVLAFIDVGLMKGVNEGGSRSPSAITVDSYWKQGQTINTFRTGPLRAKVQSDAYARYIDITYGYLKNNFREAGLNFTALPIEQQLAYIAASHLAGHANVVSLHTKGQSTTDASGAHNKAYYEYMLRLQTELSNSGKGLPNNNVGNSGRLATVNGTFVRATSPNSFVLKDGNGGEKEYQFEAVVDPASSGIIDEGKLSYKGYTLKQVQDGYTTKVGEFLSRYPNITLEETNAVSKTGLTIARVFSKDINGNTVSMNRGLLEKGYGFLDNDYISNKAYAESKEKGKAAKVGLYEPSFNVYKEVLYADVAPTTVEQKTRTFTEQQLDIASNANSQASTKDEGIILTAAQSPILPRDGTSYKVRSGFGRRKLNGNDVHLGIDIVGANGVNVNKQTVVSIAPGVVSYSGTGRGYGNYIEIKHNGGYITRYGHLSELSVKRGAVVIANQPIGKVGGAKGQAGAGDSSGPHLHYEIRYVGSNGVDRAINPLIIEDLAKAVGGKGGGVVQFDGSVSLATQRSSFADTTEASEPFRKTASVYNESLLLEKYISNLNNTLNKGMAQAFPTIKVYLTIGNEDQDYWGGAAGAIIQYYEIKGVRNFHLNTNNSTNPIDVVSMVISDPNFLRTDEMTSLTTKHNSIAVDYKTIGTDYETQFYNSRMKLVPGMKLHIRMGYNNNPNKLDIVFNGSIVSCANLHANAIQIVAEGFGKELLTDVLGTTEPKRLGGGWNSSTGTIFADLMQLPGLYHFGKSFSFLRMALDTTLGDISDPESRSLLGSGTAIFQNPFKSTSDSPVINANYLFGFKVFSNIIQRSRINTNIYSSDIEHLDNEFDSPVRNLFSTLLLFGSANQGITYDFYAVKETPWEVMKQMEYRHPGTIVKPMWYQDRCTLFYGIKEQMYIARDVERTLMNFAANEILENDSITGTPTAPGATAEYSKLRPTRMDPAFNFHIISSELNLISNGIKLNGSYYTKVNVGYRDDNEDIENPQAWGVCEMSLDDNLVPWEIRGTELNLGGCDKRYMAFRYGTKFLIDEAEKMYEGSIFILGNPSMKSGDYAYLQDDTRRLFGIIKIRECFHHFDERNGFVTEIVPGQFVEPAEFVRSTLFLRLGMASRAFLSDLTGNMMNKAFSSQTLELLQQYFYLQDQWSKLARTASTNPELVESTLGFSFGSKDRYDPNISFLDSLSEDPGFVVTQTSSGILIGLLSVAALKWAAPSGSKVSFFRKQGFKNLGNAILGTGKFLRGLATSGAVTSARATGAALSTVWKDTSITSRAYRAAKLSWVTFRGGISFAGRAALTASWAAIRGGLLVAGLASPLGLLVGAIAVLTMSWANAKIEENAYTRQPAVFYPLIQHGKPYVAGMTGAIRNQYWDSLIREGEITYAAIKKAATIINNKKAASGQERSSLLSLIASPDATKPRTTYSTDAEGRVVTNVYANGAILNR